MSQKIAGKQQKINLFRLNLNDGDWDVYSKAVCGLFEMSQTTPGIN